ncbi:MAG: RHS repeat domain-containing protein [Pseudomonadota bacterium]
MKKLAITALLTLAVTASAQAVTYTYDALGRLETVTYDNGETITYSYDANGNRTQVVVSGDPAPSDTTFIVVPMGSSYVLIPVQTGN